MPACGSMGHLTSSGSWVKTSLSGQDGEWPLTPLPPPWHLLPLSGVTLPQQSWSLLCSPLLSPKTFCTVTQWLREECSCDPSNKQKLCSQPWPMRTKAHPFSGSWLSIWKHRAPSCLPPLIDFIEEQHETQGSRAYSDCPFDLPQECYSKDILLDLSSKTILSTCAENNPKKHIYLIRNCLSSLVWGFTCHIKWICTQMDADFSECLCHDTI